VSPLCSPKCNKGKHPLNLKVICNYSKFVEAGPGVWGTGVVRQAQLG